GDDDMDKGRSQSRNKRAGLILMPERRREFKKGAMVADIVFIQGEMIDRSRAGHGQTRFFRSSDDLERKRRGHKRGMVASAGEVDEADIAIEHDRFGLVRDARKSKTRRQFALIHHAFTGQIGVLGKMNDEAIEIAHIFMTRRMTRALRMGLAPTLKAIAPARCNKPISEISAPLRPALKAAAGSTLTRPVSRARRKRKSTTAGSSTGGLVSGRARIVVTPPAAAAAVAVAIVSRCSAPGSPIKARMSMRPGDTQSPPQSMISACEGRLPRVTEAPISRITPSTARTPPRVSVSCTGSISRALISASGLWAMAEVACGMRALPLFVRQMLGQGLQYSNPDRDTHLDLLAHEASWPVSDG